ncbi:Uncharacterised protein [Mycobacteroides abscessus subsp. abscessus]|nr:Uncharacterised protein [Mycobacteroides abscessus subsp. abscessus]
MLRADSHADDPGIFALGTAMEVRRRYLGLTVAQIPRLGGPERTTWRRIVRAEQYPREDTLAAIDTVLCWPEGTAKDILELKRPIPAEDAWIELTDTRRLGMIREKLVRLQKEQERASKSQAAQRKLIDDLLGIIDKR